MSNAIVVKEFDWTAELEKTVVNSLVTTFGLDFLLTEDKFGGDVDTIHKAREWRKQLINDKEAIEKYGKSEEQEIYISDNIKSKFDHNGKNKDPYKKVVVDKNGKETLKDSYHSYSTFKDKSKKEQAKREKGELIDEYTNQLIKPSEKSQLDHVISSSEIHHDPGAELAGIDKVKASSANSNLASTKAYTNNRKDDMSVEEFLRERPKMIEAKRNSIKKNEDRLSKMSENTPEQKHKKRQIEDKIRKEKEHLRELENINENAMRAKDKEARKEYNSKINRAYYTSGKFIHATTKDMTKRGLEMGARQTFGLMLAEVWFELRKQIPTIYKRQKENFSFQAFLDDIGVTFKNIWLRMKGRFQDFFATFRDGFTSGAMASLTTTIINCFKITSQQTGKMLREAWNSLVKVIKVIFFNPDRLAMGDLMKEVSKLLSLLSATLVGVWLDFYLKTTGMAKLAIGEFKYGECLIDFLSALVTGIIHLGFIFYIEHSVLMQKVWNYLNKFKPKDNIEMALDKMKEINTELDRYLLELSKIEFNLNPAELEHFANSLAATNDELERSFILKAEVERRNIDLPFESGNLESVRSWLGSLQKS